MIFIDNLHHGFRIPDGTLKEHIFRRNGYLFFRNIAQIEDGIGDKIGMLARGFSVFLSSAVFAFGYSWRITLICVGVGPVSAITMAIMSKVRVISSRTAE
ncbi:hypothetical protein OESDEN_11632 [Oesophagostomum dentatum]|uniref:ABC transmembrane type-1 domain-containing protein n=1 Tax=Oesophagostomum dentatum TaxID=61180 RepID=A0A0B1STD8_OESDE|nr:hypothetical protein OESDEN_11632 [Oesophagostomum dentatum]